MKPKLFRVLTIDLDFFIDPVVAGLGPLLDRPSDEDHKIWPVNEIRKFLEQQLGFSKETKKTAYFITRHDEAFGILHQKIKFEKINVPFELVNIDAHADLGLGGGAWVKVLSELIKAPIEKRPDHEVVKEEMNEGNWIAFAIACRWISKFILVKPVYAGIDLFPYYFPLGKDKSTIRLHPMFEQDHLLIPMPDDGDYLSFFEERKTEEPQVEFKQLLPHEYKVTEDPDLIIVCHSPLFIPASADILINLVGEYVSYVNFLAGGDNAKN